MKLHDISLFFPSESPIPFSANEFRDETISDNGDDDNESNGSVKCSVKCSVEKLSSSEKIAAYLYICFYPNALCWLSDAEFVLWVLIGFLNGATNNDASVRYARLKKRIQELEKEVNNIGDGEQPSMQPSNDNNDGKLESINILNDYSVQ